MKILGFAGSNSTTSINKKLVTYATTFFKTAAINILDLNDFEMPIYSVELEKSMGIPSEAKIFAAHIDSSDFLIISLAEHNGAYSAAFKNIFDWISRIPNRKAFGEKHMLLMATSPGPRGGLTVLEIAKNRFQYSGGIIAETFHLPSFNENFVETKGIISKFLLQQLQQKIEEIKNQIQ
ncbi:COG0431 Predicted flavoprotein [Flavobacteriaceae bacterium]